MLAAVELVRECGAAEAARRLGVSRQSIYNALRTYKAKMEAAAASGSVGDVYQVIDEEQRRWEARQAANARQRRYTQRRRENGASASVATTRQRVHGDGARLPAHLKVYFDQCKANKRLCAALVTAMRRDATMGQLPFVGWTDQRVAAELARLKKWTLVDDTKRIARALCLEWRLATNSYGYWVPDEFKSATDSAD